MFLPFIYIIAGFGLLYVGAELLVRGGGGIARYAGMSPLVVGLTVVAFGTSSPELLASGTAVWLGQPDIAVGNVVGSNIGNIALILGLAAIIHPISVSARLIKIEIPLLIFVTAGVATLLYTDNLNALAGTGLLFGLVLYTSLSIWRARQEPLVVKTQLTGTSPRPSSSFWRHLAAAILGLAMLGLGAHLFVSGAITTAETLGVSDWLIGVTLVAIGTSLPELAATLVAALRGHTDIAVGNIIGSNLFNLLGILGPVAMLIPLKEVSVDLVDLAFLTGLSLALLPLMRTGWSLSRREGALLILLYVGYIGFLITA